MNKLLAITLAALLSACTAVTVKPVPAEHKLTYVCIQENPKVTIPGFANVLEKVFEENLILTELTNAKAASQCDYRLTYHALRSWDIATYLSHAELKLYNGPTRIGYAEYHLRAKGGIMPTKWAGVESKMRPVINKLLAEQNQ